MSCTDYVHKPGRAELGRAAWVILHAEADALPPKDAEALASYIAMARGLIHNYPCTDCKKSAEAECSFHVSALEDLQNRASVTNLTYRVVAVAWAARFHACVTRTLLNKNEESSGKKAAVSQTSIMLAMNILFLGSNDMTIAEFVRGSQK